MPDGLSPLLFSPGPNIVLLKLIVKVEECLGKIQCPFEDGVPQLYFAL